MINIRDVSFSYPRSEKLVLNKLNMNISDGEFLCVIGHSGCGKSTLLRLVAGLDLPTGGEIAVDGEKISGPSADRSIVFQQYSLFPWLSVKQNVVFAVHKTGRFSKEEAEKRAEYFLAKVGLANATEDFPYQLSGGMRQRTAIARALAMDSPYLLLDEPFGALDTKIKKDLQILLQNLWKETNKTVVFITHDLEEALLLGNRIVFLDEGCIRKEKRIGEQINSCCCKELGRADCMALKEELAGWFK